MTLANVEQLALIFAWAKWEDVSLWHVMLTLGTGEPHAIVLLASLAASGILPPWADLQRVSVGNGDLGSGLC